MTSDLTKVRHHLTDILNLTSIGQTEDDPKFQAIFVHADQAFQMIMHMEAEEKKRAKSASFWSRFQW